MIYSQILKQHVTNPQQKFNPAVQKFTDPLIDAALYLHDKIAATFLPTVIKFHYVFNLRDLTNIFQVRVAKYINRRHDFPRNNGDNPLPILRTGNAFRPWRCFTTSESHNQALRS